MATATEGSPQRYKLTRFSDTEHRWAFAAIPANRSPLALSAGTPARGRVINKSTRRALSDLPWKRAAAKCLMGKTFSSRGT